MSAAHRRRRSLGALVATLTCLLGLAIAVPAFSTPVVDAPVLTSTPPAATSSTSASFAWTGPSGATYQCSLDGAAFTACSSPRSLTGLTERAHSFAVKAVTKQGTSSATSYSWTVDRTPPPVPGFTGGPTGVSNSSTFAWTDSEAGVTFVCGMDTGATSPCISPATWSGLSQGAHTVSVLAVDAAGNQSQPSSRSWTYDSVPPAAPTLTTKPSDPTVNATNDFAWTVSSDTVEQQCSLENGAWSTCSSPYRWVIETSNYGQHQFAVRARDIAGNWATTKYTFKYEKGLSDQGVPFTITGTVPALPLGIPRTVSLTLKNPNPVPIFVQALDVRVSSSPAGCDAATNLKITPSTVSSTNTVTVPANGSLVLDPALSPRLELVNRPVNQDACKNVSFGLTYSGTATN